MKNGKTTKPSAPGDGQIKNWTNREGAQERGEQRQNYPWREGRGAKLLKTNMAATTLRASAADGL